MHQRRFGSFDGKVYIVRAGGVDGGDWLVGAAPVIKSRLCGLQEIRDIRGIKRDDCLSGRGNKFVVDEETGGLLVGVPVGRDDVDRQSHD